MRKRRAILAALLVAAAAGAGRPVLAGPPTEADLRAAEEAFVHGRYEDVAVLLAGAETAEDAEPLAVLDLWWRPLRRDPPVFAVAGGPAAPLPGGRLAAARLEYLRAAAKATVAGGAGPYPPPRSDERDPWPRVTALVLDRLRRTTVGVSGLPEDSPLRALKDPYLDILLDDVAKPAYAGPQSVVERWSPEDRDAQRRTDANVRRVALRNRLTALAALAVLVGGAGFALHALRTRREPTDPPERGG